MSYHCREGLGSGPRRVPVGSDDSTENKSVAARRKLAYLTQPSWAAEGGGQAHLLRGAQFGVSRDGLAPHCARVGGRGVTR